MCGYGVCVRVLARLRACLCARTRQRGTKSPANPFTGNGCHPSNPFKFDLAIDKKKGLHDRSLFSDWRRWKRRVAGKLNEAGGGIPGLTRLSVLNKSNIALFRSVCPMAERFMVQIPLHPSLPLCPWTRHLTLIAPNVAFKCSFTWRCISTSGSCSLVWERCSVRLTGKSIYVPTLTSGHELWVMA